MFHIIEDNPGDLENLEAKLWCKWWDERNSRLESPVATAFCLVQRIYFGSFLDDSKSRGISWCNRTLLWQLCTTRWLQMNYTGKLQGSGVLPEGVMAFMATRSLTCPCKLGTLWPPCWLGGKRGEKCPGAGRASNKCICKSPMPNFVPKMVPLLPKTCALSLSRVSSGELLLAHGRRGRPRGLGSRHGSMTQHMAASEAAACRRPSTNFSRFWSGGKNFGFSWFPKMFWLSGPKFWFKSFSTFRMSTRNIDHGTNGVEAEAVACL